MKETSIILLLVMCFINQSYKTTITKKRKPVIVWQPSHQTNTGVDFSEAAIETKPHLKEYKVWSFGNKDMLHADIGSNTAISETSAIVDDKLSGFAFEIQQSNKYNSQIMIAVHNNGGTKRNAVWGYLLRR